MLPTLRAACALLAFAHAAGAAETVPLADLLRRPQYDDMSISPGGDYLAAVVMLDDRSVLTILRRSDMQLTGRINPGKDGFVDGAFWVNPERLFASTSIKVGLNAGASSLSTLYGVDADGSHGKHFPASIVDTLAGDDDHVLISVCDRSAGLKGCWNKVKRAHVQLKGAMDDVAKAPALNAQFVADNAGRVRFAYSFDNDDNQQLHVRGAAEDAPWTLIHDELETGVELLPLAIGANDEVAYLTAEQKLGPDAVVAYDLATGERREVLRDTVADPEDFVFSADRREVIGAAYHVGAPRQRFWQPRHPDAVLQAEVAALFPGEFARVTSSSTDRHHAVVTVTSDREPGRFYLLDTVAGEIKLLNRRRPWLKAEQLAAMQPIELKARDGLPLHGYLATPPGIDTKNLPLVVLVHGGPYWLRDDWAFDEDTQVLATRGYAVLRVNFRGSGGFGRAFADAGLREWGGRMQDDVTDATRWAIERGIADPKRVCIMGASYGGYAALMGAVKEPDLYRCAVGVAGVYDLALMKKWGDIQRSRYGEKYLDRALGTDSSQLAQRSPARRAKEIKAAVMLIHGGRDFRVSPEHVKAMRRGLDEAGIKYEGWFPSYESHGIADEKNLNDYYTRVLAFLDRQIGASRAAGR